MGEELAHTNLVRVQFDAKTVAPDKVVLLLCMLAGLQAGV